MSTKKEREELARKDSLDSSVSHLKAMGFTDKQLSLAASAMSLVWTEAGLFHIGETLIELRTEQKEQRETRGL